MQSCYGGGTLLRMVQALCVSLPAVLDHGLRLRLAGCVH
jgi:hypothetical protein